MRARRREINIFNMSLLDILCGALGAFCFMMLVALPYYKPPGSAKDLKKAQEETQKLMGDLDKMKERLPDQKSIEEMEELLRRLEAQIKVLQGQVNILSAEKEELARRIIQILAENEQLKGQIAPLQAEIEQLKSQLRQLTSENELLTKAVAQVQAEKKQLEEANQQLAAKARELDAANEQLRKQFQVTRIVSVIARADRSSDIDILFTSHPERQDKDHSGFKDWLSRGERDDHLRDFLYSRGTAIKAKYFGPAGTQHVVYLRNAVGPDERETTVIDSSLMSDYDRLIVRLPRVTVTKERFWTLFGTITIGDGPDPVFKEATAAERDSEWEAVTATTPPPTPTPTPTPTPLSAEEIARRREQGAQAREAHLKFSKLMRLRQGTEADEAEMLKLADELLKELPPGDLKRRHVEGIREQALALKARREGTPSPSPQTSRAASTPRLFPPPPPRPSPVVTP